MKITTEFDINQEVYVIDDNTIVKLRIVLITTRNKAVEYTLLKRKAATCLDKDVYIEREEKNCFGSIADLVKSIEDNG